MNAKQKVLLATAAMTGLLAGASARAAVVVPANATTTAKPATITTTHHGVRGLDGPTSKPAGSGTAKGQNACGSVL